VELGADDVDDSSPIFDFQGNLKVLRHNFPLLEYALYKLGVTYQWNILYLLTENCLE